MFGIHCRMNISGLGSDTQLGCIAVAFTFISDIENRYRCSAGKLIHPASTNRAFTADSEHLVRIRLDGSQAIGKKSWLATAQAKGFPGSGWGFALSPFFLEPGLCILTIDNRRSLPIQYGHTFAEPSPHCCRCTFSRFGKFRYRIGMAWANAAKVRLPLLARGHRADPYSEVERNRFDAIQASISSGR